MSANLRNLNDLDIPDNFVLPPGDIIRGQKIFKKQCANCHCIVHDRATRVWGRLDGPNLYGVMGRTAGTNQRTAVRGTSNDLKQSGIVWTDATMMKFLKNPKLFAGLGIKMDYAGLPSFEDRVDLVWYMKVAGHDQFYAKGNVNTQEAHWQRHRPLTAALRNKFTINREGSGDNTDKFASMSPMDLEIDPGFLGFFRQTKRKILYSLGWVSPEEAALMQSYGTAAGTEAARREVPSDDIFVPSNVRRIDLTTGTQEDHYSYNWPRNIDQFRNQEATESAADEAKRLREQLMSVKMDEFEGKESSSRSLTSEPTTPGLAAKLASGGGEKGVRIAPHVVIYTREGKVQA